MNTKPNKIGTLFTIRALGFEVKETIKKDGKRHITNY